MISRADQNWPANMSVESDGQLIAKILSDPGLTLLEITDKVLESEPEDEFERRTR